jgi:hypothetical protein
MSQGSEYEINFEGAISDSLKKDIEALAGVGFDPEGGGKPKDAGGIGEFVCIDSEDEHEMIQRLEKMIESSNPGERIAFDFIDEFPIVALEIALRNKMDFITANGIKIAVTDRMAAKVKSLQARRDRRSRNDYKGFDPARGA